MYTKNDIVTNKTKSIVFKLTTFAIVIIILQTFFFSASLVLGGVLKESRNNALKSFDETVISRKSYLEREMKNSWTNLQPFTEQISEKLSNEFGSDESLLFDVSDTLIDMLRSTRATGVYLILGNDLSQEKYQALYFRDYDPLSNNYSNDDIYTIIGPSDISKNLKIPLDQTWKYNYEITEANQDFFIRPYSKNHLTKDSSLLGYWSKPFRLSPNDLDVITYSMPIFDKDKSLRGIIGIEITLNYFVQLLPATDLQPQDSLGYMLAYKKSEKDDLMPVISVGAFQKRIMNLESPLKLDNIDNDRGIYILKDHNMKKEIYASVKKIGLYRNNTPFESESWYLIGFMREDYIFKHSKKIQSIILLSFGISLIAGILGSIYFSFKFSKPIIKLADKVRISGKNKKISLDSTGLREVDELARAMELAKDDMLKSASRLSGIIQMLDVPIGAFEISSTSKEVFVTDNLFSIMGIAEEDAYKYINKEDFQKILDVIYNFEDPNEKGIYKIEDWPLKWIKIDISKNDNTTTGVIRDVTKEMLEKIQIQNERDLDPLTKLYNRRAFQQIFEHKYQEANLEVAALMMFDLDNLKFINDTYGHKWGDIYIVESVNRLRSLGNSENLVLGRRSGDEFAVLVFGYSSRNEIIKEIDRFYEYLKRSPLEFPGRDRREIGISGGIVWLQSKEMDYDEMIHMADSALYRAKNNNKGGYEISQ